MRNQSVTRSTASCTFECAVRIRGAHLASHASVVVTSTASQLCARGYRLVSFRSRPRRKTVVTGISGPDLLESLAKDAEPARVEPAQPDPEAIATLLEQPSQGSSVGGSGAIDLHATSAAGRQRAHVVG
jgi:hypothetical protein